MTQLSNAQLFLLLMLAFMACVAAKLMPQMEDSMPKPDQMIICRNCRSDTPKAKPKCVMCGKPVVYRHPVLVMPETQTELWPKPAA
jgi:uncharacterized paraquat-inducible protein A